MIRRRLQRRSHASELTITGAIPSPFGLLVDVTGGPVDVFGEQLLLGYAGLGAGRGRRIREVRTAASRCAAAGSSAWALYAQPLLLTAQSRNGLFQALNGAITVFHGRHRRDRRRLHRSDRQRLSGQLSRGRGSVTCARRVLHRTKDTWDAGAAL